MALMLDTNMDDAWIAAAMRANPPQRVRDQSGNLTDNVLSGICRLAFAEHPVGGLLRVNSPKLDLKTNKTADPKFSAILLFPPGTDLTALRAAHWDKTVKEWASRYHAPTQSFPDLHDPFHPQAKKVKYPGFTPGGEYIAASANAKFKPSVVDSAFNPIVDEDQVRSGVWAVVMLNTYKYGENQPVKGIGFGLLSVMVMQQDRRLGGLGAIDPRSAFSGVVNTPAVADPNAMFAAPRPPVQGGNAAPPPYGAPASVAAPIPSYRAPAQGAGKECFLCGTVNPSYAATCSACGASS